MINDGRFGSVGTDPLSDRMDKVEAGVTESLRLVRETLEAENRVLDMLVDRLAELEKRGHEKR